MLNSGLASRLKTTKELARDYERVGEMEAVEAAAELEAEVNGRGRQSTERTFVPL